MTTLNSAVRSLMPKRVQRQGKNTQGSVGYDNPRENIDPHIKTRVLDTKEIVGQSVNLSGDITLERNAVSSPKLIFIAAGGTTELYQTGNEFAIDGNAIVPRDCRPWTHATYDLGRETAAWRNIYITGNVINPASPVNISGGLIAHHGNVVTDGNVSGAALNISGALWVGSDEYVGVGNTSPIVPFHVTGFMYAEDEIYASGNITTESDLDVDGRGRTTGDMIVRGNIDCENNISGARLTTTGHISGATLNVNGTISGGNLATTGHISGATMNISGALCVGSNENVGVGIPNTAANFEVFKSGAVSPVVGGVPTLVKFASPSGTVPWALRQNATEASTPTLMAYETSNGNLGYMGATTNAFTVYASTGNSLYLGSNNSNNRVVLTSGNIFGIGITNPLGKVHIQHTAATYEYITTSAAADVAIFFANSYPSSPNWAGIGFDQSEDNLKIFNWNSMTNHIVIGNTGDVSIGTNTHSSKLFVSGAIASATRTFETAGPTDNVDVSKINTLFLSGAVTIGGFAGGVDGQILHVVSITEAGNKVIEHNEAEATQPILLHAGADETIDGHFGGWTFVCHDGVDWHDASHAKHV